MASTKTAGYKDAQLVDVLQFCKETPNRRS